MSCIRSSPSWPTLRASACRPKCRGTTTEASAAADGIVRISLVLSRAFRCGLSVERERPPTSWRNVTSGCRRDDSEIVATFEATRRANRGWLATGERLKSMAVFRDISDLAQIRQHPRDGWILVAEDDEDTRAEVREALEDQGYAVVEARNGREALDVVFGENPPDIRMVITDIYMPEVSGFELLNVLSAYYRPSRIPFVVVSVSPRRASQLGIVGWLEKPFDIDALLALVRPHVAPRSPE